MKLQMGNHGTSGLLITFCGLDGCGKTTQINLLREALIDMSLPVICTKQPTNVVRESEMFRTFMDAENHDEYDYRALSLLCASDRVQHSNKVIRPWLESGNIVISDRYFYCCLSNLRARGYTGDAWIYDVARSIPAPDFSFFLDVPVEVSVARVRSRPDERDRYIDMDLQYRLRDECLSIAKATNGIILNGEESLEYNHNKIMKLVRRQINDSRQSKWSADKIFLHG